MRVPNTMDAGAAIDPPAGSINFDDLLLDVDPVLIKDNCQEFAHCFEERLDPGVFARLAAVCRAFRKVVQCGGSKLHLTVNDWEAHGKQGTKDALNKYKKIKLKPRMVAMRDIPVDPAKPLGATFRGRVDVPWGGAVYVDGCCVRVDLVLANTSLVREKLVMDQPFFCKGKRGDELEIAPLDFYLGKTLSRHDSPFGLYQLRVRMDAYIQPNPDVGAYANGGILKTYEYTTPAFHIVGPNAIPKPNSARQKELLDGGGKRGRFS